MNEFNIVVLIILWGLLSLGINLDFLSRQGTVYFNPVKNYENWDSLNWFGVSVFTLLINIAFLPMAILYWVFKFFAFIFTVRRR